MIDFLLNLFLRIFPKTYADPETCDHDWVVMACVISDVSIDVICYGCGLVGNVPDPTEDEWIANADAMENDYRWHAPDRVITHGKVWRP
ncbi:hypothetical protein [Thalassovita mediterranea]|jgi:hypothetical protein|uniref:Uncharacterized protein n=1 Tax=Thalassovita mediterranea TaxID=340021 RepID=A0A0P1GPN3_9RHOB|nr:hypothetical protein [Thalassovita mediterranea]CUH84542.1 hypothetical protein TM5383_01753 [Thalassovita mediterranea]SIS34386.1 hypothetical protein SAMN05421685_110127 [Thalassovita mediterranea]